MNLYFISGLGADEKAFARIHLNNVNVTHIEWVAHSKEDTITTYSKKLIPQINLKEPFALIALSFGGIIAQELNKFIKPEKTILISSVTHHSQFPFYYQLGKYTVPLLSDSFFNQSNFLINYLFGAKGKSTTVLSNILRDSEPKFVKWCVVQLLKWRKSSSVDNVVSIHGTNDKIIPYHKCDYTVKDGSHFMVYSKPGEVQTILQKEIDSIERA